MKVKIENKSIGEGEPGVIIAEAGINHNGDVELVMIMRTGILKHGCFHKPAGMGVDESMIWGDYYFIEALMKYKGVERWNTKGKG